MPGDERRLSEAFADLQQSGQAPTKGKGKTAERVERDKERVTRRFPSEDDRVGRKISPTLSRALVRRLQEICKAEGHVGSNGGGVIASEVIEDLLWGAVEAYERGEFERAEEVIVRQRLRRRPSAE